MNPPQLEVVDTEGTEGRLVAAVGGAAEATAGMPGVGPARGEGLGLVAGAVAGSLFLLELVLLAAASPPKGTVGDLARFLGTHRFVSAVVASAGVAGAALLVPFASVVVTRAWRHRAAAPWVGWTALASSGDRQRHAGRPPGRDLRLCHVARRGRTVDPQARDGGTA